MKKLVLAGLAVLVFLGCKLSLTMSTTPISGTNLFIGLMALGIIITLFYLGAEYVFSRD